MDTEAILSKLDEITQLLQISCQQQLEILDFLHQRDSSGTTYSGQPVPYAPDPLPDDIPEIPSIEFPFRPEDTLICPKCRMMQSSSHDVCSHCGVPFIFLSETSKKS